MLCEHSICFADKRVEMRRNKEIISENLKLRKLAGVLPFLSFTFPPQLQMSLSETDKSVLWTKWTGWSSSGKENWAMPPCSRSSGRAFYKQKLSSEAFMAAIKGAGGSGESVVFSSSLWKTRQGMFFNASWIVLEMWRRERERLGKNDFLEHGAEECPRHHFIQAAPRSPNREA